MRYNVSIPIKIEMNICGLLLSFPPIEDATIPEIIPAINVAIPPKIKSSTEELSI